MYIISIIKTIIEGQIKYLKNTTVSIKRGWSNKSEMWQSKYILYEEVVIVAKLNEEIKRRAVVETMDDDPNPPPTPPPIILSYLLLYNSVYDYQDYPK